MISNLVNSMSCSTASYSAYSIFGFRTANLLSPQQIPTESLTFHLYNLPNLARYRFLHMLKLSNHHLMLQSRNLNTSSLNHRWLPLKRLLVMAEKIGPSTSCNILLTMGIKVFISLTWTICLRLGHRLITFFFFFLLDLLSSLGLANYCYDSCAGCAYCVDCCLLLFCCLVTLVFLHQK